MTEWPGIRRLENGAIDYDFYRASARAFRVQAIRDAFRAKPLTNLMPMAAALLAVAALFIFAGTGVR